MRLGRAVDLQEWIRDDDREVSEGLLMLVQNVAEDDMLLSACKEIGICRWHSLEENAGLPRFLD